MPLNLAADREIAPAGSAAAPLEAVEFRVEVQRDAGSARVCPVGEIDIATVGQLRARLDEAIATGAAHVILDLRETTFIDSTGLHAVIAADARATRSGTRFMIIAGPRDVQRAFDIAGLSDRLSFADVPRT